MDDQRSCFELPPHQSSSVVAYVAAKLASQQANAVTEVCTFCDMVVSICAYERPGSIEDSGLYQLELITFCNLQVIDMRSDTVTKPTYQASTQILPIQFAWPACNHPRIIFGNPLFTYDIGR